MQRDDESIHEIHTVTESDMLQMSLLIAQLPEESHRGANAAFHIIQPRRELWSYSYRRRAVKPRQLACSSTWDGCLTLI